MFSVYFSSLSNASRRYLGSRTSKNVSFFRCINREDFHLPLLKRIPWNQALRRNHRQHRKNNSFRITEDLIKSAVKDSALINKSSLSQKRYASIPKVILFVLGTTSIAIITSIAVSYYRFSNDNKERKLFIPIWINPNILGKGCLNFPKALKYVDHEAFDDFTKEQDCPDELGRRNLSSSLKEDNIRQNALEELLLNPSIRRLLRVPTKVSLELKQNHFWVETEKSTIHGVQVSFSERYPFCINFSWLIKFFEPFLMVSDAVGLDVLKLDEMLSSEDIPIEVQETTVGDNYHRNRLKYYTVYSLGEYQLHTESHIQEATLHYKGCIDFDHPTMNNGFKVTQLILFVKDNDKSIKYKIV